MSESESESELKIFIERSYSSLFLPKHCFKTSMEQERSGTRYKLSFLFMIYLSIIIGIASWFLILYPEPLYYGVSGTEFQQDMPTMITPNIPLALLILILISFTTLFLFQYIFIGFLGYRSNFKNRERESDISHAFRDYLTLYAHSFTPFLFLIPIITIRIFFFEKLIMMGPFFPFIDLNPSNLIFLSLFGLIFFWKFYIEIHLNRQFFGSSRLRATMPVFLQLGILLVLFLSVYFISLMFFDSIIGVVM